MCTCTIDVPMAIKWFKKMLYASLLRSHCSTLGTCTIYTWPRICLHLSYHSHQGHLASRTRVTTLRILNLCWHTKCVFRRISIRIFFLLKCVSDSDTFTQSCLPNRFRRTFVEVLQPRFLPASWDVEHTAARKFGDFSIYNEKEQVLGQAPVS